MELFSVILSPLHPRLSPLYKQLGLNEHRFSSERKAIQALRKMTPDILIADFIYGYGSNYAGVNVSNLDVILYSLQKSAPQVKVFLFCEKNEMQFTDKLPKVVDIEGQYLYPVDQTAFRENLSQIVSSQA